MTTAAEAIPSSKKPSTAAFKLMPPTKAERDRIRDVAAAVVAPLDKSQPITRDQTQTLAEKMLTDLGTEPGYLGFAMVMLTNAFWRDQVAAIPFQRRL
ncbi:MAG: polyprenyl synthetase family protein, partial [Gemmataceae bacterium]